MIPGMQKQATGANNEQNAAATHSPTATESSFTTVAAQLPGGAVGMPKFVDVSGSVAGLVQVQIGSQAVKTSAVAPNQMPVRIPIPPNSFPNKVGSVNVEFEGFAAGTLSAIVTFSVG